MDFNTLMNIAEEAVQAGGTIALEWQSKLSDKDVTVKGMGGRDIATSGDIASQQKVLEVLKARCPDIPLIGEEEQTQEEKLAMLKQPLFAVTDPVDGTTNYKHQQPYWGTTVAFFQDGLPVAGAIYLPRFNKMAKAGWDQGCFLNGQKWTLERSEKLAEAVVGIEWGWWLDADRVRRQGQLAMAAMGTRAFLSAVVGIMEVLQGDASAYTNLHVPEKGASIWDFGAGAIVLKEAFRASRIEDVMTSPDGSPIKWQQALSLEAICANSLALLQEIVAVLN